MKVMKKKPKKGAKPDAKPQMKTEKVESFFNFFDPPQVSRGAACVHDGRGGAHAPAVERQGGALAPACWDSQWELQAAMPLVADLMLPFQVVQRLCTALRCTAGAW